ncbi:hypothetical protein AVO42_00455 [Thiomicrospira sp. XS5]|uniref:gp436 family protein n=1 Tax=Thiomicrospira sp. XS5 TaxID=1775636 RepID=UPI0007481F86|nr:DUF1320 domain-containing protein [Thiomicrospira sp. XS5]KUJ73927.1 hypothetical protein AVO42_00455 [Thiomicrospira sp. XS5]
MAYCTVADLQARFDSWELVDLTNPGGDSVDTPALEQVILDAEAEIESYLGGRYALPIDPVPKVLNRIACNIARYYLYDNEVPEPVEKAYQRALGFLKDVSRGLAELGIAADGNEATGTESTAEMQSDPTVWGRNESGGFI